MSNIISGIVVPIGVPKKDLPIIKVLPKLSKKLKVLK